MLYTAAGNEGLDMDALQAGGWFYGPCLSRLPNVLCVSATDKADRLAPFTNYGTARTVPLAAPGVDILSTLPGMCVYAVHKGRGELFGLQVHIGVWEATNDAGSRLARQPGTQMYYELLESEA